MSSERNTVTNTRPSLLLPTSRVQTYFPSIISTIIIVVVIIIIVIVIVFMVIIFVEHLLASIHPAHMAFSTFHHQPFPLSQGVRLPRFSLDYWTLVPTTDCRLVLSEHDASSSESEPWPWLWLWPWPWPCPLPLARSHVKLIVPPKRWLKSKDGWEG